eukprot:c23755_g2_i1 orf=183-1397(+)
MVVAGSAPSLSSFQIHSLSSSSQNGLPLLNLPPHKWQSATMGARVMKPNLRRTSSRPCLDSDKQSMHSFFPVEPSIPYLSWKDVPVCKASKCKRLTCHALLEGSDQTDSALDLQSEKIQASDPQESAPGQIYTAGNSNANVKSFNNGEFKGRSGLVSFYSHGTSQPKLEQQVQTSGDAWVSVLWMLGPAVLVSSVVLPPFFLRKIFEILLEDSLVTDFLILFFTETLFYAGVFVFLMVAHKVQQATGILTWNSGSRASLGYKLSSYATMALAVMLPIGAFAIVWPWTGPAAAAALLPYIAGLAVQYGFEQVVQEKKWSVWPLIPIIFQVYRLHQLNRATQLVAGLLYSLRGAEATAETLAVNGSLQTLVTVLQLLGMLCLWALTAYLTHAFSSESQDWQSRVLS